MTAYIHALYAVTIYPIGLFYMNPIEPQCIENVHNFVKSVTLFLPKHQSSHPLPIV
jgi:hypothetical protein